MRKFKPFYVAPWCDGFSVTTDNGYRYYTIGPNPLPERGAECVLKIIERLRDFGMNLNPNSNSKRRTLANMNAIRDDRLRAWLENRI